MNKVDEFKAFVKTKPELISYVRNGSMTWQKFYELWYLFGPSHEEWNKYPGSGPKEEKEETLAKASSFLGLGELFNALKKVDMENVKQGITGVQKAIGLIQEMTNKGDSSTGKEETRESYRPRPIYRRFED